MPFAARSAGSPSATRSSGPGAPTASSSLAFIDVDGLKGVNDRDGHAAGDRVLRTLAAIHARRPDALDPIVRFGGDEFVCGIASIDPGDVQHRIGVMDQSLRNATGIGYHRRAWRSSPRTRAWTS